jgi:nitric oxide reductase subunit B
MQFGTIFGHGAYLGPDFTASYLHNSALQAKQFYSGRGQSEAEVNLRVRQEFKKNRYNPRTESLVYTTGQVFAFEKMEDYYRKWFGQPSTQKGLQRPYIRLTSTD